MHNKMIARHQIAPKGDFMPEKLWGFRAEEEQAAAWKGSRPGEPGSHLQSSVKTFSTFMLSIQNCLQCQQSWSMLPRNKKIFKFKLAWKMAFFPYVSPKVYERAFCIFLFRQHEIMMGGSSLPVTGVWGWLALAPEGKCFTLGSVGDREPLVVGELFSDFVGECTNSSQTLPQLITNLGF